MNLVSIQIIFLQDIARLIQYAASIGIFLTAGRAYSTSEEQRAYYDKKLSKTLNSQHCNRLAMDFNFFRVDDGKTISVDDKKTLQPLADYWCGLDQKNTCGLIWGWDFYHFERKV